MTLAAHFWPRGIEERRYPPRARLYPTEPGVEVLVHEQQPRGRARGEFVLLHGLESSSRAGYMLSMARAAVEAGFTAHRVNTRSCGGTEHLCRTLYHSGLTVDLRSILDTLRSEGRGPFFLVGYSLGGNVALKLVGELGESARGLVAGVCAVSAPIDLLRCVKRLEARENSLYHSRFLRLMKKRMRLRHRRMPELFPIDGLDRVRSVYEFDDRFTAPAFGFPGAEQYYTTQSAQRFLASIRVPTLVVAAQDDPLVPFEMFRHEALGENSLIELLAPRHGGHAGFLARGRRRFWLDQVAVEWACSLCGPGARIPGREGDQ
jgi:hypothetical protein